VILGSALGWADVYEGTRKLGRTPLRVELRSGTHRLTVRPYGDGPVRFLTVLVQPAQAVKMDLGLQW
jgi:hypothetical protein